MIDSFRGKFFFLSNFYPSRIMFDGEVYPTVEHAYQAAKTLSDLQRHTIRVAITSGVAKRLGRNVTLRKDWEEVKLEVMEDLLVKKFSEPRLAVDLKSTDSEELVEGNDWGDIFWGVCQGRGENHLGKILMKIRATLQ